MVVLGSTAIITGEFAAYAGWLFAGGLGVLGVAGLVATATAVSR